MKIRTWMGLVLVIGGGGSMGGCNVAQAVETITRPDPVVEAKFDLAPGPAVIMFDDQRSVVTPVRLRRDVAEEATVVLMECADMSEMISPMDAMRLAHKLDRKGRASISAVGKGVGANQVIYVEPIVFSVPAIVGTSEPRAVFRVKVVESATSTRLWPSDDEGGAAGWGVQVVMTRDEAMRLAAQSNAAVMRELARRSGDEIARLFCDTAYSQHGNRLLLQ